MMAVALVLCLALGLPGWHAPVPGQAYAQRASAILAQRSPSTGTHLATKGHASVSRGQAPGAASGPPRLSSPVPEGGRPWPALGPDLRAWRDAYTARVAVHVQRLRPGAASHVGHAPADQPPVVTCPLRGPPALQAG